MTTVLSMNSLHLPELQLTASAVELRGTKFVNLTPHALNLLGNFGLTIVPVDTEILAPVLDKEHVLNMLGGGVSAVQAVPRCEVREVETTETGDVFRTFVSQFGELTNLPAQREHVLYIVSALAQSAALKLGRNDFVTVHAVRNDKGQIIGCDGFVAAL